MEDAFFNGMIVGILIGAAVMFGVAEWFRRNRWQATINKTVIVDSKEVLAYRVHDRANEREHLFHPSDVDVIRRTN